MRKIVIIFSCFILALSSCAQAVQYDKVTPIRSENNAFSFVEKEKKFGIIDSLGNVIVPVKYAQIQLCKKLHSSEKRYARVCLNGKWGFVDLATGKEIAIIYDEVDCFFEGYSVLDLKSIAFVYDNIDMEGYAKVKLQNKYGYIQ